MSQATDQIITNIADALNRGDADGVLAGLGLAAAPQGALAVCPGFLIPVSAPNESLPSSERTEPSPMIADSASGTGLSRRNLMNMIVTGAAAAAATPLMPARVAAAGMPAGDRRALESYAAWLHMERRLLCRELYPDMGSAA